jgi:iron-sulfur cluster repair protein YtfE (RIC family)
MVSTFRMTSADFAFARYEHAQLKGELDEIRTAAYTVGRLPALDVAKAVSRVRAWLVTTLGPHVAWENLVVYPEIDRATATTSATRLMRSEHRQIERMCPVLEADIELLRTGAVTHERVRDIRAHLLGLESLLRAHIDREDEFLQPEIDSPDQR